MDPWTKARRRPRGRVEMLFGFIGFHLRETLTVRTLVLFAAVLLATAFLFLAMPYLAVSGDRISYELSLSIVDPDQSLISEALASLMGNMNNMGEVYREDIETARARLSSNEILMIIQMPPGFYDISLSLEKRPPITLWLNPRMPAETAIFVRALRSFSDSIAGIQAAYVSFGELIRPLYSDVNDYNQELTDTFSQLAVWALTRRAVVTTDETARMSTPLHVISGLMCLMCMQMGLLMMAQAAEERKSGVMVRMALSQAPWWASPLARQLAGLLWAGVALAPMVAGLKIYYPQARLEYILPAIFGLFWVTAAVCQGAGYLSGGSVFALPGMWMAILVFLLLGGCIYPQTLLPDALKPLMALSPAHFAYRTVYAGLQGDSVPEGALANFFTMAVVSAVFLRLAWKKSLGADKLRRQG